MFATLARRFAATAGTLGTAMLSTAVHAQIQLPGSGGAGRTVIDQKIKSLGTDAFALLVTLFGVVCAVMLIVILTGFLTNRIEGNKAVSWMVIALFGSVVSYITLMVLGYNPLNAL